MPPAQDPERFRSTYWQRFGPHTYLVGDGARIDHDGYTWILGRIDDVINVSGHRLGTMEIESALVAHPAVAEAAVVPMPHDLKGPIHGMMQQGMDAMKKKLEAT